MLYKIILLFVIFSITTFFVACLIYKMLTDHFLKKHQREWDEIKENCSKDEMYEMYLNYITNLKSHFLVGKCIPRM